MRQMRTGAMAAVALLAVAGPVLGDVATPRPKWTAVRMLAEDVQIAIGADRVRVDATFTMHNTGAAATVRMGYPLGEFEQTLQDFAATVDGKPIEGVQTQESGQKAPRGGLMPRGGGGGGMRAGGGGAKGVAAEPYRFEGPYKEWKVFDVAFGADEKKTVRVRYWVAPAQVTDQKAGSMLFYCYTLKTGATWKGTIGEATLTVALDDPKCQLVRVVPGGYHKDAKGKRLVWRMKDFEPASNIEIAFRPPALAAKR